MKRLLYWVLPAVAVVLVILCASHVAPEVLAYTVIPALAALTVIARSWMERRQRL